MRSLFDIPEYLSEMVTEYAVGNCQRKGRWPVQEAPEEKLPVINSVFIQHTYDDYRTKQGQDLIERDAGL